MTRIRRSLSAAGLAACLALGAAAPVAAADEVNLSRGLTAAGAPLAMRGYDPVAYFEVSAPTPGHAEFAAVHEGATYYFASRENREAFEDDPERYAPAFGGYCAYGVSVGKKFDADPRYWTISGGRLYLNLNQEISRTFGEDVAGHVAEAETQWKKIAREPVGAL